VVDRRSQFVEESAEPVEVGRVEGGDAAIDLETGALHALRVACRDNHLGSQDQRGTGSRLPHPTSGQSR